LFIKEPKTTTSKPEHPVCRDTLHAEALLKRPAGSPTLKGAQLATWVRAARTSGTITLNASTMGLAAASVELASAEVPGLPPLLPGRGG
jgi:hypothetical protein